MRNNRSSSRRTRRSIKRKNLRGNESKIERDLVLKERKIYVLKNEELKVEII